MSNSLSSENIFPLTVHFWAASIITIYIFPNIYPSVCFWLFFFPFCFSLWKTNALKPRRKLSLYVLPIFCNFACTNFWRESLNMGHHLLLFLLKNQKPLVVPPLFFSFIFISWRLIKWVLPYIDMNQPWIYMCSPSRSPIPPPSPFPFLEGEDGTPWPREPNALHWEYSKLSYYPHVTYF